MPQYITFLTHVLIFVKLSKGTATLEPELTQHSKPTFVWVYIADMCGYIQSNMRVRTYS